MKTKKAFLSALFGASTLFSVLLPINITDNYLNNILIATASTPNQRSLVKLENTNFDDADFSGFRKNVFQTTNGNGNGFRAVGNKTYKIKYNNQDIDLPFDLLDYDFDVTSTYNSSLLFLSYGAAPPRDRVNDIIIEYKLASFIQSNDNLFEISDVIGKSIYLGSVVSFSDDAIASGQEFVISGIYYENNRKDFYSYANMFYGDSFESPIFIRSLALDELNFTDNITYYASLVNKPNLEYVERSFKLVYSLVDKNLEDISFPSVPSNQTPSTFPIYLPSLQEDLNKLSKSVGNIVISLLLGSLSIILLYIIIIDDIKLMKSKNGLKGFDYWSTLLVFPFVTLVVIAVINMLFEGNILISGSYYYSVNPYTLITYLITCFIYFVSVILFTYKKESEFTL